MAVSRRKFIKAGTLVVLSAGVPLQVVAASSPDPLNTKVLPGARPSGFGMLTQSSFSAQLKTKFRVAESARRSVSVELTEVNDLRPTALKQAAELDGRECFSLIFVGPQQTPLHQNTYRIEHRALGKFSMLLVPVGQNEKGRVYEAVFNRLH